MLPKRTPDRSGGDKTRDKMEGRERDGTALEAKCSSLELAAHYVGVFSVGVVPVHYT